MNLDNEVDTQDEDLKDISPQVLESIRQIGDQFAIEGEMIDGKEISTGLINSTYMATYEHADGIQARYVFQRINEKVFTNPLAVMQNIECVTRHINWKVLRIRKDSAGRTLNLYPARGGKCYAQGPGGGVWRCYNYIEGCRTYDVIENTRQAYQAAFAFGSFQDLVSDLPVAEIHETIKGFHHTPTRYQQLQMAIKNDALSRVSEVRAELAFVEQRAHYIHKIVDAIAAGTLPIRITHNDTKINNVMIDVKTDKAVCVIDLDTVMPGSTLYDFGDMVRTATSPVAEDEVDLAKVTMQISMFEALVEGYLDAAGGFLTRQEIELLPFSGKLIALEIGMRFLTDYLSGDHYFKIERPQHNLDRARTQLKLIESIEDQEDAMKRFVRKCANSL